MFGISLSGRVLGAAVLAAAVTLLMPLAPNRAEAEDMAASVARGGQLYDKWFAVIGAEKPADTHPLWPATNTKKTGDVTHRCKSCHGWDLKGADGAYASGSYQTGITGLGAYAGGSPDAVIAIVKNDAHGFAGKMDDQDYVDLANFVTAGQIDMAMYIDYGAKTANGDAARGEAYYNGLCAGCHGADGKKIKDMDHPVGDLARGNPWEILHKVLFGQPKEAMPALNSLPIEYSVDILAYIQTLPD